MRRFEARPAQDLADSQKNQNALQQVQEQIDEMITKGALGAGLLEVQPKTEHQQRPHLAQPAHQRNAGGIGMHVGKVHVVQKERAPERRPIDFEDRDEGDQQTRSVDPQQGIRLRFHRGDRRCRTFRFLAFVTLHWS